MPDPIVYIDTSEIRDGKLDEVKARVKGLAAFVEANNPHILSYGFFFDDDAGRMMVVAVHPDSEALEHHMDVGREEFRKFGDLLDLVSIEVYGEVSESVRERLDQKASMLGRGGVSIYGSHAGFAR
ncbi:MAG: putative quinol monooxygenase [Gemmatimonadota bacterium]